MMDDKNEKIIISIDADIKELMPGFLLNRQKDIKSIKEALEHNDYYNIQILGHSMKGSGSGYGLDTISDIGASLEKAAKERNSEDIKNLVNKLSEYLGQIKIIYE
ncbi:MAG: Hpt domain-containing protein [Nitrospinota bacterium]